MSGKEFLHSFLPDDRVGIELDLNLVDVVNRISVVIPKDLVFKLYTSTPGQTGGKSRFPYYRTDSHLLTCKEQVALLANYSELIEHQQAYTLAALDAFSTLVWVEVGFQGLDNLADNPASVSWTIGIGHKLSSSQRASRIKTIGAANYLEAINSFVEFRDNHETPDDLFIEHSLEYLLDQFR